MDEIQLFNSVSVIPGFFILQINRTIHKHFRIYCKQNKHIVNKVANSTNVGCKLVN